MGLPPLLTTPLPLVRVKHSTILPALPMVKMYVKTNTTSQLHRGRFDVVPDDAM